MSVTVRDSIVNNMLEKLESTRCAPYRSHATLLRGAKGVGKSLFSRLQSAGLLTKQCGLTDGISLVAFLVERASVLRARGRTGLPPPHRRCCCSPSCAARRAGARHGAERARRAGRGGRGHGHGREELTWPADAGIRY